MVRVEIQALDKKAPRSGKPLMRYRVNGGEWTTCNYTTFEADNFGDGY